MADNKKYRVLNLKQVSAKSGVPYQKIYDNLILERYNSLDFNERTLMCNAIVSELTPVLKELGFKVAVSRISKVPSKV